tara:strand:- start:987 stop:1799 length:813 start_codon:yes stop_codon:yes gene_type:complete
MRNTNNRNALVSSLILSLALAIGCVTVPKNLSKDWVPSTKSRTTAPIDAFTLVVIKYTVSPTSCSTSDKDIDCNEILDELPIIEASATGSGVLVESKYGPVVITAAHVCNEEFPAQFEDKEEGIKIEIESKADITLEVPTKGSYSAEIIKTDEHSDLCMLKPSEVFTHPVPLSKTAPVLGDVVYSISAPFGISGSSMALIFKGFYSGTDTIGEDKIAEFYTVPARPGSSGGPIFNTEWELIGIIHTAFTNLESVGIGSGLDPVTRFLYGD